MVCTLPQLFAYLFNQAVMGKDSAAALGGKPIDWALASKQHDGYVDALSKIVDSVEVRRTRNRCIISARCAFAARLQVVVISVSLSLLSLLIWPHVTLMPLG